MRALRAGSPVAKQADQQMTAWAEKMPGANP